MARLLKCYGYCGKKYPKEELTKLNLNKNSSSPGLNYCSECYNRKVKETADREDLYKFIQDTYNLEFPTGQMLRQIKMLNQERGYTYKNIRFTLDYVFNIKKNYSPITKFGVSMVPYFHDEMIEYYKSLKERRQNLKLVNTEPKVIEIEPFKTNEDYKYKKLISTEDIL